MKNVITKELQFTQTNISFCYGEKAYIKFMLENNYPEGAINIDATTSIITNKTGFFTIVIGIKKRSCVYSLKGLVVHEISHAVTEWMLYYGFKCDEVRSYALQFLYQEFMLFLDERLQKGT